MAGTNGAVWGIKQLYLSTPTQVVLVFVAAGEGHGHSLLEDVDVGSNQSTLTVRDGWFSIEQSCDKRFLHMTGMLLS
jgi:hypothetical protein